MSQNERPSMADETTLDAPQPDRSFRGAGSSLEAVQVNRKLQKITSSVESFLFNQVERLSEALRTCREANEQAERFQSQLDSFEEKRAEWELQKETETNRLNLACEKLIEGWKQLENEKRQWMGERARNPKQTRSTSVVSQNLITNEECLVQNPNANLALNEAAELHQLNKLRREIQNHSRRR